MINMGNYYVKTNRLDEARQWFNRAVEGDTYNYLAHIGLGVQTVRSGNINDGVPHIIEAVKLKPDFVRGYDILATIYRKIDLEDKAKACEELKQLFGE
jgi:predicted Zn-dependent protease